MEAKVLESRQVTPEPRLRMLSAVAGRGGALNWAGLDRICLAVAPPARERASLGGGAGRRGAEPSASGHC